MICVDRPLCCIYLSSKPSNIINCNVLLELLIKLIDKLILLANDSVCYVEKAIILDFIFFKSLYCILNFILCIFFDRTLINISFIFTSNKDMLKPINSPVLHAANRLKIILQYCSKKRLSKLFKYF